VGRQMRWLVQQLLTAGKDHRHSDVHVGQESDGLLLGQGAQLLLQTTAGG